MTAIATHLERHLARAAATTARWKQARQTPQPVAQLVDAADWLTRAVFFVWRNRRYLTTLKLGNMALVNLQYLLKTERVIGRPYNMKIESTNICNTHCQLCPTGLGLRGRPKGQMTLDQYKQLIDRFRWHLFGLDLSMWGDPLIVPHIYDMIRYAHDRGIWTYLSSNLHAFKLNPKPGQKPQAQKLVESGLDMLTCSLHGASQSTYETYQPGKRFHDALEKIRQIIQTRDRLGSTTPVVQLNFVVTRHNEHEREAFQKLADDLGCRAVFSTAMMNVRFLDKDQQLQPLGLAEDVLAQKVRDHLANWLPRDSRYVLEPYKEIARTG
ncbi:MAG TPA: radical SAM protein, partial [Phycisphaeraceae bacterium]